ncbi:MAG: hypothetical protein AAF394_00855, partial [Planctomycetota bacterium]
MSEFQQIACDAKVTKVEIHDMVAFGHASLIDSVEKFIFAKDRDWEAIHFRDEIDLIDYGLWRDKVDSLMSNYEAFGVQ